MIYFPQSVFTNILAYADDRIERNQKRALSECLTTLNNLPDGWYYNHILHQDSNYGSDWDGDGDEGEHIGYYIFVIMMEHSTDGFLMNDYDDFNEERITDFKNRIKSYSI